MGGRPAADACQNAVRRTAAIPPVIVPALALMVFLWSSSTPSPVVRFWSVVVPVQVTVVPMSGLTEEVTGSQAASARSSAANVEIVTAIISACRSFNNFGFADFISILNSGQNSHRRVAGIDLSGAIQRLSERRTDAHGGSTQNNL